MAVELIGKIKQANGQEFKLVDAKDIEGGDGNTLPVETLPTTVLQTSDVIDSFDNAATDKPLSAKKGKELKEEVDALSAGYLGDMLASAAQPMPATSGYYKFSSGGVVDWLSYTLVYAGDTLSVTRISANDFEYKHISGQYDIIDDLTTDGAGKALSAGMGKELNEKIQLFQDDYVDSYPVYLLDWSSANITENFEHNFFGYNSKSNKVEILNHIGNTLGFNLGDTAGKTGFSLNVDILLYSPVSFIIDLDTYTNGGTIEYITPKKISIALGINYTHIGLKVISSGTLNQIIFANHDLIGTTLYIRGYYYEGLKKSSFNNKDYPDVVLKTAKDYTDAETIARNTAIDNEAKLRSTADNYILQQLQEESSARNAALQTAKEYTDVEIDVLNINIFQDDYVDKTKVEIFGWESIHVIPDENTNVFGRIIACDKVEVLPHNGNTLGFYIGDVYTQDVGLIKNIHFAIYSPIEFKTDVYAFCGDGTLEFIQGSSLDIHIGINFCFFSVKILTVGYYRRWQIYFRCLDLIGKTLYINGYKYNGVKKNDLSDSPYKILFENYSCKLNSDHYTPLVKTVDENGYITYEHPVNNNTVGWFFWNLSLDNLRNFEPWHEYYVALDAIILDDAKTVNQNYYGLINPKFNDGVSCGSGIVKSGLVHNSRGLLKAKLSIDNEPVITANPSSKNIFFQSGYYESNETFKIKIFNMVCIDLTKFGITWDEADQYVQQYGIVKSKSIIPVAAYSDRAKVAESVETFTIGSTIDLWGDSLVAQGWGNNLARILNREVVTHGYGGKTSTFIRDQFLLSTTKSRTQIINVGRNDYWKIDEVVDNIRMIVENIGHRNFLICSPPNGIFTSQGEIATSTDSAFYKLERILSNEFGANYLNSRLGTIFSYGNGNVKLLSSFIQPNIDSNVQIHLSDANFLFNTNQSDLSFLGSDIVNKIAIGINGQYDIYMPISVDSNTLLTVKLIASNRIFQGSIVDNLVDSGTDSLIYLRVLQNADLYCLTNEITQSTFRSDGIHMSEAGLECIANVVARKIVSMKI